MSGMWKILIVEDDIFLRQAFRMMLEDAGYVVGEAGSGAETIESVQLDRPDLILLDLGLPDKSGLDVARELKADPETSEIVIVALTGSVGAAEKRACIEAGCKTYFAKPMSPKELLRRLPELLERPLDT
jgi:two-component system, cell cycle response regulator DivK